MAVPVDAWDMVGKDYMHVLIDWGAVYLKVATKHTRAGQNAVHVPINHIPLYPGEFKTEQIMVIDDQDELLFGELKVKTWQRQHPEEADRIVRYPKSALCPQHDKQGSARSVWSALDLEQENDVVLQDLIQKQLAAIKEKIIDWYCRHPKSINLGYSRQYWGNLLIHAIVTIPCMWNDRARGIMTNAVMGAGYERFNPHYEPLCAAAD